jgi:hypothetical protein
MENYYLTIVTVLSLLSLLLLSNTVVMSLDMVVQVEKNNLFSSSALHVFHAVNCKEGLFALGEGSVIASLRFLA